MSEWQIHQRRKQTVANLFYATLFALIVVSIFGMIGFVIYKALTMP